jgi:hypothetical protein
MICEISKRLLIALYSMSRTHSRLVFVYFFILRHDEDEDEDEGLDGLG